MFTQVRSDSESEDDSTAQSTRGRRWPRILGVMVLLAVSLPVQLFGGFWLLALPENLASELGTRSGSMPPDAHVLYSEFGIENRRPIVSASWHTCDSSPFRVGGFSIDLLSREVVEASSEDWGGEGEPAY